jgi:hypothetical protein
MNPLSRIFPKLRDRLAQLRREAPPVCLQVTNITRHTVLANCMEVADSGAKRNKGLLGRKCLYPGQGMWILPCEAVHTIGMQFSIDLVYLDRKNRIKKLRSAVPPWRMSACLTAHSVIELPSGTIRKTETSLGDKLEFSSSAPPDDSAGAPFSVVK